MPVIGNKSLIWDELSGAQCIVVTTHVRPDGDAIASELALSMVLKSMGKEVLIVNQDKTPEIYRWLPQSNTIISLEEGWSYSGANINLSVLLDCSSKSRIGKVYDIIQAAEKIISIDHHESTDCLKNHCYIDTEASSIGEILYKLIPEIDSYLNRDIATCLYTSILTDTGSFAYSNTSSEVFRIVSHLIEYDVDPTLAYNMVYNNKSLSHFRLLGRVLQLMETDESGKVLHVLLPLSIYRETGAREEDNEGILEVIKGLKDVDLIILLRQLDDRRIKCSLRSINSIDCNYLAKLFGGGGHLKASGFVTEGNVSVTGASIVDKILGEVKRLDWI